MAKRNIIGREREIQILDQLSASKEAEFLAIYGRRRVGKTHLIREYFSGKKGIYLEVTGQKDGTKMDQLENFAQSFSGAFFDGVDIRTPANWKEAFRIFTREVAKLSRSQKVILFLDELPWLASKRSGMLQALDYYWNRHWSSLRNLIVIVCGSAASWMLDHLINAKGGLYNRLTRTILLRPYTLRGAKAFLHERGIKLSSKQVLELYFVFGGIPHYLKQVKKGESATQIINRVCFQPDGLLFGEFDRLFSSLFEAGEVNLSLIRAISSSREGLTREEIIRKTKISSGGTLKQRLTELESAGFIQSYIPYGRRKKDHYFRIIDEYCHFYLRWIEPLRSKGLNGGKTYWRTRVKTASALAWRGYAFEMICLKHVEQIREALTLQMIPCEVGSWRYVPKKGSHEQGAQIDLLFDRDDGIITICEIKYSDQAYSIDKAYAKELLNKMEVFEKHFPTNKQVFLAMITSAGLKRTIWTEDLVNNHVILDDLFKS